MSETTVIDVYADVVCPFAYIGLDRLISRRRELARDDVRFRIRSWPLELVNSKPVDGHFISEEIDEVKPQVAPDLFGGFREDAFPASSIPALALTLRAYETDVELGERVAMALRRALFEDGRDISDDAVIAEIAEEYGVERIGSAESDEAAVRADYEQGRAAGVVGSPHFVLGGDSVFCPVLDIGRVDGQLLVSFDEQATAELMDAIFGTH